MTTKDVQEFSRKVNSFVIGADNMEEMYRKLNTLRKNGHPEWNVLRAPMWVGTRLMAVVVRPDHEYIAELDEKARLRGIS